MSTDQHTARIRELDDGWIAAARRRDLDGMMAIYAPDAREMLPGMPAVVGREAMRALYAGLLSTQPRFDTVFSPEEIIVSGDLAVVRGWYRFTPDTAEPSKVDVGKFIGIWRHDGGDWRLVINIS